MAAGAKDKKLSYRRGTTQHAVSVEILSTAARVTGSHVNCESGNISKTLQDGVAVTTITDRKFYMANRIATVPMAWSYLQNHSPIAGLFK